MGKATRAALAVLALGVIAVAAPRAAVAQDIVTSGLHEPAPEAPPEPAPDGTAPPEPALAQTAPDETAPAEAADAAIEPSDAVRRVLAWVIASGDNGGLPILVVDKLAAQVFVFDAEAHLLGATAALLGAAAGDESTPGIGDRKLSAIGPDERVTPAGRFVAGFGRAAGGRKVLWVDYASAVSLHPVVTANRKERRLDRLYSPTAEDNRITYGCINVPAAFYEHLVGPLFKDTSGVAYILPDSKPLDQVFPIRHAQAPPSPPHEGSF